MEKTIVAYHNGCFDGFTGAWAAWKALGDSAEYIGLEYQEPIPESLRDATIYFIDFCYPTAILAEIKKDNKKIIVLDHHLTQEESAKSADEYRFALDHSGASIAWSYFHPEKAVPKLISYVEDQDLYRLSLPHIKEIATAMSLFPMNFETWDSVAKGFEDEAYFNELAAKGAHILEAKYASIERLLRDAEHVSFEGHETYAINSQVHYSEVANAIYQKFPVEFGIVWFYKHGTLHVSLRSKGVVNVAALAQRYGGGGHAAAAGFSVPFESGLPWSTLTETVTQSHA